MSTYLIVCANGEPHRDYGVGEVSQAATEQAALDAAEFMDDERDNSPWTCGPHKVDNAPWQETSS